MSRWKRRARRVVGRLLPPRPGALILGYHRLADPRSASGAEPRAMCVSPETFAAQMAMLRRLGRPVSLRHLGETLAAGVSVRGMIAVTFDDGYEEVLRALPVLEEERIPATVFFVAGNAGRSFWWDRLAALLADVDVSVPFRISTASFEFVWPGVGGREQLRVRLHRSLRILGDEERDRVLGRLAITCATGTETGPPADLRDAAAAKLPRALKLDEARSLIASRWVDPGAHSLSHPPLAEIAPRRAHEEIHGARAALRRALGVDVTVFSYPHGSVNPATAALVRDAGYELACISRTDSVRATTDRWMLPRMWVRDRAGGDFRRRVRRYLGPAAGAGAA